MEKESSLPDGPKGPKVLSDSPSKKEKPNGDSGSSKKRRVDRSLSEYVALETEPSNSKSGDFEELVEQRMIKRRNSFSEKSKGPQASFAKARTPNMFMALIGDKEMSDPEIESMSDDDQDLTTSKESAQPDNSDQSFQYHTSR